ncbi:MAG TPA: hypothetical protein ENK53_03420 [Thiotrichales bacterium]|nr:hypothetical protein [Thiotrichales bacterium]
MTWTPHRVLIAIPVTDRAAARFLWRFLDPDTGGEATFDQPNWTKNGAPWLVACTQLESDLWPALRDAMPDGIEAKVLLRRRRKRAAEVLPTRSALAALRSRMFVARVPDNEDPRALLEKAGFVEVPRGPGP